MSDVIDRPALEQETSANNRGSSIAMIHPSLHARSILSVCQRWQEHLDLRRSRTPYIGTRSHS
jgi:hypothetical protein